MKRPSTLEVYSINEYDSTEDYNWDLGYITYTIYYDCSAMNGYGGYARSTEKIFVEFKLDRRGIPGVTATGKPYGKHARNNAGNNFLQKDFFKFFYLFHSYAPSVAETAVSSILKSQ